MKKDTRPAVKSRKDPSHATPSPIPENELLRLETLRRARILDTLPEKAFDDFVRLASLVCEAPIALISLVDSDRQWFKARSGLEIQVLPRHNSFCAHAIMNPGEVMLIPDTLLDERFREHELVTGEAHIRFYAGAPLVMSNGLPIGTLCVFDTRPREMTAVQTATLKALRDSVVNELERRQNSLDVNARQDVLLRILHNLANLQEADEIIQTAVNAIFQLGRWQRIGISVPAEAGQSWQTRAEGHRPGGETLHPNSTLAGVIGRAYRSGEIQFVEDASADPDFITCNSMDQTGSELVIPIKFDGEMLGALNLESDRRSAFTQEDVDFAQSVAEAIAIALQNARRLAALQTEINQRRQTEVTLSASEARYRQLTDHSHSIITVVDWDGRILFSNPAGVRMWNGPDLVGKTVFDLYPPEYARRHLAVIQRIIDQQVDFSGETESLLAGRSVWFRFSLSPIRDPDGSVTSALLNAWDITEIKQTELALREARDQFEQRVQERTAEVQNLYDNAPCGYITSDRAGRITQVNQTFLNWIGFSREELLGRLYIDLVLPEEAHRITDPDFFSNYLQLGEISNLEFTLVRKDGSRFPALSNASILLDAEGRFIGSQATIFDNTEQKKIGDVLRQSEAQYRYLFENNPHPMFAYELATSKFLQVNEVMEMKYGYSHAEFLNMDITDLQPDEKSINQANLLLNPGERWHRLKDGRLIVVEIASHAITLAGRKAMLVAAQDITARKQAEAAQLASQAELQNFLDTARDMIQSMDDAGNYLYVNEAWSRTLGYSLEEARKLSMLEVIEPGFQDHCLAIMKDLIVTRQPRQIETVFRTRQGEPVLVEGSLSSRLNQAGKFVTNGIFRDVTQRKMAETALRESESQNRLLFEESPDSIALLTHRGVILRANRACETMTGLPADQMIGRNFVDLGLMSAGVVRDINTVFLNAMAGGSAYSAFEYNLTRKDGELREIESRIYWIQIAGRSHALITSRDVTERKQAEQALRESEAQNRLLFEESPEPVVLLDAEDRLVRANHAYEQLTGLPLEKMLGKTSVELDLITPETRARLYEEISRFLFSRDPASDSPMLPVSEYTLHRPDGTTREVQSRSFLLKIDGKPHGLITTRDITIQKQATEAMRQANQEMQRALRLKDEFLATMSHELRTPLNGILGLSEVLLEEYRGPLNDYQKKLVRTVETSGRHLLSLINDVLDLSKLEARQMEINPETVVVNDLCNASLAFVKEQAARKSIQLSYVSDAGSVLIKADMRRMKQILINLLGNAVKFTPNGGKVRLEVRSRPEQNRIDFQVIDTGIGIAPADIERLFTPFVQIDSSLTREHGGTGLGLVLVKRMAELHGGSVSVTSEPGNGSCFTVSMPGQPSTSIHPEVVDLLSAAEAAPPSSFRPARILLVEDNEVNILTIVEFLESLGYTLIIAKNGKEALAKAEKETPELILMDVQLPDMNGLDAIRRLRTNPGFSSTPIIALTALAMSGDRERCLEAGANEYMSKPVSLKQLSETIIQLLEKQ